MIRHGSKYDAFKNMYRGGHFAKYLSNPSFQKQTEKIREHYDTLSNYKINWKQAPEKKFILLSQ